MLLGLPAGDAVKDCFVSGNAALTESLVDIAILGNKVTRRAAKHGLQSVDSMAASSTQSRGSAQDEETAIKRQRVLDIRIKYESSPSQKKGSKRMIANLQDQLKMLSSIRIGGDNAEYQAIVRRILDALREEEQDIIAHCSGSSSSSSTSRLNLGNILDTPSPSTTML